MAYIVSVLLDKYPIEDMGIGLSYVPDQPDDGTATVLVDLDARKWKVRSNLRGWVAKFGPGSGTIAESMDYTELLAPSGNKLVALRYFSIANRKQLKGFLHCDPNPKPEGNIITGIRNVYFSYSYYWRKLDAGEMTTREKVEEMLFIASEKYIVPELKSQLAGLVSAENLKTTGGIFACFVVAGAMGFSLLIGAMKVLLGMLDVATNYMEYESHWRLFYRNATQRTTANGLEQGAEAIAAILSGLLAGHIGGKMTEAVLTPAGKAFPADQFREKVLNVTPERWMSAGKKQVAVEQQATARAQQGPESPLTGLQEDLRNGRITPEQFKQKAEAVERAAIATGTRGENICTKTWEENYKAYKKEADTLQRLENEAHRRGDAVAERQIMLERLEVEIEAETLYGFVKETDGHARVLEQSAHIVNCYLPVWKKLGRDGIRRLFATEGLEFSDEEMTAFIADRDALTKVDFTGHDKVGLAHKFLSIVAEGLKYKHKPSSKMSDAEWKKMVEQNPGAAKQAVIMSLSQKLHNVFSDHHPPLGSAKDFWEMAIDVVHARYQERCYSGSEPLHKQKFGKDSVRERASFIMAKYVLSRMIKAQGERKIKRPQDFSQIERPAFSAKMEKPKPTAVPVHNTGGTIHTATRDKATGKRPAPKVITPQLPGPSYPVYRKKG
ncbi:MAG: hypothetical protein J0L64_11160 [Acidobacteria bacterium]|nr:hypothetical protein [Acidobacteriota bacterium]